MASVALIQGGSGALGTAFVRHLLRTTQLNVVTTTRTPANEARSAILDPHPDLASDRLTVLEMDLLDESSIAKAAKDVEGRFGKASLRLLVNVSGVLHADRSITQVKLEELMHQYQINTFGHLLTYKHFLPLLPKTADVRKARERGDPDLANGAIKEGLSVLASLTARVGSIGDNKKGGWIGYRSSKAATNQVVTTLQRELSMRSTPSIAVSLHPGTIPGTTLSAKFTKVEDANVKPGMFTAEESTRLLMEVVKGLGEGDGGRFIDWAGKDIVW